MLSTPESLGNLGTTMTFSLLFHLLFRGHFFFFVATSHSWQGDNPVLPGSPTCWWHQTLSGLCFFFFPTAGVLSCHKPFPRLSLRSLSSLPAPDVHRLLHCGLCPALLLLGFKTCYPPPNDHSLKNHRKKLFSFLCVITIKEVFTFLPESRQKMLM